MPRLEMPLDIATVIKVIFDGSHYHVVPGSDALGLTKALWDLYSKYKAANYTTLSDLETLYHGSDQKQGLKANYKKQNNIVTDFFDNKLDAIWFAFEKLKATNIASHDELYDELKCANSKFDHLNYFYSQLSIPALGKSYNFLNLLFFNAKIEAMSFFLNDNLIKNYFITNGSNLLQILAYLGNCTDDHFKCVDLLRSIEVKIQPNLEENVQLSKMTALQLAMLRSNIDNVKFIAALYPETINYIDSAGNSTLEKWFKVYNIPVTRLTQSQEDDLRKRQLAIFEFLLEQGEKIRSNIPKLAVEYAPQLVAPIVKKLLGYDLSIGSIKDMLPENFCLIRYLLRFNHPELAERLLRLGWQENPLALEKTPALQLAAARGYVACIKVLLIQKGHRKAYARSVFFAITANAAKHDEVTIEQFKHQSSKHFSKEIFLILIAAMLNYQPDIIKLFLPEILQSKIHQDETTQNKLIQVYIDQYCSAWPAKQKEDLFLAIPLLLTYYLSDQKTHTLIKTITTQPEGFCIVKWSLQCGFVRLSEKLLITAIQVKNGYNASLDKLVIEAVSLGAARYYFYDANIYQLTKAMILTLRLGKWDAYKMVWTLMEGRSAKLTDSEADDLLKDIEGLQGMVLVDAIGKFVINEINLKELTEILSDKTCVIRWCIRNQFPQVALLLLEKGIREKPSKEASALELASSLGCKDLVIWLLANVKNESQHLQSALMKATEHGHIDVLQVFCDFGINIKILSLLLNMAYTFNRIDVICYLLKLGISPNGQVGAPIFGTAIFQTNIPVLSLLLEFGVDVKLAEVKSKLTPLHFAVKNPKIEEDFIKTLLARGADPLAIDAKGFTPYSLVCSSYQSGKMPRDLAILRLLEAAITAGISPLAKLAEQNKSDELIQALKDSNKANLSDKEGIEIVIAALMSANFQLLNNLFNYDPSIIVVMSQENKSLQNDRSILYWSANFGVDTHACINILNALLYFMLGINDSLEHAHTFPSDFCIIRTLIQSKKEKLVSYLLDKGIRENPTSEKHPAAVVAAEHNLAGLTVRLMQQNKDVCMQKENINELIAIAIENGCLETIKAINNYDESILKYYDFVASVRAIKLAIHYRQLPIFSYLLTLNNDPKINYNKFLIYAARMNCYEIVDYLLSNYKHVIDVNTQRDGTKETALHFAAKENNAKLIKLLLLHGADPNIEDNECLVPLDLITENNEESQKCFELLSAVTRPLEMRNDNAASHNNYSFQK